MVHWTYHGHEANETALELINANIAQQEIMGPVIN